MREKTDLLVTITPALPAGYADWLKQLKTDIIRTQQRAALSVNTELVQLYGRIGHDILQRSQSQSRGQHYPAANHSVMVKDKKWEVMDAEIKKASA